jgi:hypothetical protein
MTFHAFFHKQIISAISQNKETNQKGNSFDVRRSRRHIPAYTREREAYTRRGGVIFGREGAYGQRFTVYVKRGPDIPTKKTASGQCPRPFLSLPCGTYLNQAMCLSVVFGLKWNLV